MYYVSGSKHVGMVAVRDSSDQLIGEVFVIPTGPRLVYVAMAHDWEGDPATPIAGYYPVVVGTFDDPELAYGEIERRAREAQAPTTLPHPDQVAVDAVDVVAAPSDVACGKYWVAEIASCPTCGRPSGEHARRPAGVE